MTDPTTTPNTPVLDDKLAELGALIDAECKTIMAAALRVRNAIDTKHGRLLAMQARRGRVRRPPTTWSTTAAASRSPTA